MATTHHPAERTYVVNEERASVVRYIFARYQEGTSQYGIARELNHEGSLRPSGKPSSNRQVDPLLGNPAYASLCIVVASCARLAPVSKVSAAGLIRPPLARS